MTKSGRPTIDDALARRISDALSSDAGLAGDAELSSKLATDKAAGSYAKDLGRIDKWLASWPLPEPSEEQLEALASRVEQRLKDLPTGSMLPFLAPPEFDDDDALRDATASLLTAGKAKVPAAKAVIPKPAALLVPEARGAGAVKPEPVKKALDAGPKPGVGKLPQPAKPLEAKAPLGKPVAKVPLPAVEPPAPEPPAAPPEPAVEEKPAPPASAAPAEVDAAAEPTPPVAEAEAKTASPSAAPPAPETSGEYQTISLPPEAAESVPEVALPKPPKAVTAKAKDDSKKTKHESPPKPPKRALGPAPSAKVDDRISIPMPTPLAPVVQLDAARAAAPEKKKGGGLWPLLAAAAVVGLTVAVGGSFLFAGRSAAPASAPIAAVDERRENEGETATVTSAPAVAAVAPAPPASPTVPAAVPMGGAAAFAETPAEPAAEALLLSDSTVAETSTREPAAAESTATPVATRRARVGGGDDDLYRAGPGSSGGSRGSPSTGSSPSTASADDAEGRSTGGSAGGARSGAGSGAARGGAASGSSGSGGSSASPPTDGASGSGGRVRGGEVESGGDLPETPSRDAVRDALDGVAPQVYACYGDDHGLAEVAVIVAGSGRVTTCTVSGRFAGTPVGSCIARAVRAARFPPFSQERFTVNYEYRH